MAAPRKTNSIARAVTRSHHWGGSGAHYTQEIAKGPKQVAHFKNAMSQMTFDRHEALRASLNLRLHGSFVAAAKCEILWRQPAADPTAGVMCGGDAEATDAANREALETVSSKMLSRREMTCNW